MPAAETHRGYGCGGTATPRNTSLVAEFATVVATGGVALPVSTITASELPTSVVSPVDAIRVTVVPVTYPARPRNPVSAPASTMAMTGVDQAAVHVKPPPSAGERTYLPIPPPVVFRSSAR